MRRQQVMGMPKVQVWPIRDLIQIRVRKSFHPCYKGTRKALRLLNRPQNCRFCLQKGGNRPQNCGNCPEIRVVGHNEPHWGVAKYLFGPI